MKKIPETLKSVNKMKQKKHDHRIASFKYQGIVSSNAKCTTLTNDFENHRLDILAMQKIHLLGYELKY